MKKLLSISLAVLMIAMSLKMTLAVHYCGDTIAQTSIGFGIPAGMGCGMEGEQNENTCKFPSVDATSCCKNHIAEVSIDTEHSSTQTSVELVNHIAAFLPYYINFPFPNITSFYKESIFYRPPPDIRRVVLSFIQVFII